MRIAAANHSQALRLDGTRITPDRIFDKLGSTDWRDSEKVRGKDHGEGHGNHQNEIEPGVTFYRGTCLEGSASNYMK